MSLKTTKKLSALDLTPKQVVKKGKETKLKGGACCTRNSHNSYSSRNNYSKRNSWGW